MRRAGRLLWVAFLLLATSAGNRAQAAAISPRLQGAVVRVYVTTQRPDYAMPWQMLPPDYGSGSGFVIAGRRILTNAHVVSDARFIEVQRDGDPRRYPARVTFTGHDCDLAILEPMDPAFFAGVRPMRMASQLPALNEEVTVLGFPLGGSRISVTRGVVSRIDYSVYSHSGVDQHLVLQVDAAINPGNSGGPILLGDRVVALAFQGLAGAENIGYGIPLPVLEHFLADVEDGTYNGYPELGVAFLPIRNPALRADLALPEPERGVAVTYVDPYGSGAGILRDRDVLLAVDGHPIADDGTVQLNGGRVNFSELMERKQWGEEVRFDIWRDRALLHCAIPLTNPVDPFLYRNVYGEQPRYLVRAGLVFCPLSREVLDSLDEVPGNNAELLDYLSDYAKLDGYHRRLDEFVVLIRRLPHPVNAYADAFVLGVVTRANGRPVRSLADLASAWDAPAGRYHVLRFEGMDGDLVLDVAGTARTAAEIAREYALPVDTRLEATR
jgi:S1-C subfamily serine protease